MKKSETVSFDCERCGKACRVRHPDPGVTVRRVSGFSPQMICTKCLDKTRRAAGAPPPKASPATIKKNDAAKNLKLWSGEWNERGEA